MKQVTVSVIVPTYNRPKLLDRALKSIEAQIYKDYEIIVVNDAGEDVQEVIDKFHGIKYIQHEINKGLAATRNTGIVASNGKYITFLDDDDIIKPDHFQGLINAMNKGALLAYTNYYIWDNDEKMRKAVSHSKYYDVEELYEHNLFPVHCAMIDRKLFKDCLFDETLNSHEDWDLWIRMSKKADFVHIPQYTAVYSKRGTPEQISYRDYHVEAFKKVKEKYAGTLQMPALTQAEIKEKILLFMPTYEIDGVIQAWPDAYESFNNLIIPDNYEVDRIVGLDNPYGLEGRHRNTLHQYQMIRRKFLDEGYDILVTFEHDMIVPEDGLIKLLDTPVPVVYGLYMLRHGAYCVNAFLHIENSPNPHKSITYLPRKYKEAERRGWTRVSGVGMGFTLFRRKVLEMFDFRASGDSYPPDWAISVDCTKYGIKQVCRFDVKCGHIEKNGIPVYPQYESEAGMIKVKILKQFVSGELYKPGQITFISAEKVDDFFRAGYIEILNGPELPAVKILRKPDKEFTKKVKKTVNKE